MQALGKAHPRVTKQTPVCDLINVVEVHHTMRDINSACNLQKITSKYIKRFHHQLVPIFNVTIPMLSLSKTHTLTPTTNLVHHGTVNLSVLKEKGKWKPEFD